jgi:hypothetical protein
VLPRGNDLVAEFLGFCLALGMLRSRSLALTGQALRLNGKSFNRAFELTGNLPQAFGYGGVCKQVRARILYFHFGS